MASIVIQFFILTSVCCLAFRIDDRSARIMPSRRSLNTTPLPRSRQTSLQAGPPSLEPETTRRKFVWLTGSLLTGATTVFSLQPAQAAEDARLFRPNPLTNSVLEQIRIWEQAEADELKYGGELERGDAGNKGKTDAYPRLLVPILQMANELDRVNTLVHDKDQWTQVQRILDQPQYQKIQFKKIFNAFGDNIYYSDPDRANLFLGGGATPQTEQSLAYLLRNDILTNVEALQAEVPYLLKHPTESTDDLYDYANLANKAMKRYLDLVPPNQLKQAGEYLAAAAASSS